MRALALTQPEVDALVRVLSPEQGEDLTEHRDRLIEAIGRSADGPVSVRNVAQALRVAAELLEAVPMGARRATIWGLACPPAALLAEAEHLETVVQTIARELKP